MTRPDRAAAIETLFHAALELPPGRRRAFLIERAAGDSELVAAVERLLAADEDAATGPTTGGVAAAAGALLGEPADRIGSQLGPYRITGVLGAGGMGVVYLAHREDVGAQVALKVLRDPLSADATRRFLQERRVLARLRHPGIAQLFDAGTDPDGAPWFALELVDGKPLPAHCAETGASLRERVRLFRLVCDAVGYAHRQLVIHRDLKPSNVLVTSAGAVKLIDFGVAEADADPGADGARALTPAYSAPEQLRGEPASVSSDVYSLGVLLHELVTGRRPANAGTPPWPPAPGDGSLDQRDLESICRTALAADPAARYPSVEALERDLDRLLRELPLERSVGVADRLRKLWRRRSRRIAIAAVGLVAAGAAAASYTIGLARARTAAVAEASRATRLQRMLVDLFQGGDESAGPTDSLRVVTLVDRGVEEAATLGSEPALQADLYETLGTVSRQLGRLDRADSLLQLSLARRRADPADDDRALAGGLTALGLLRAEQARFPEADSLVREGIAMLTRTAGPASPRVAEGYEALAEVLELAGRYPEAIAALQRAIAIGGPGADTTAELAPRWYSLANNFYYAGELDSAETLNRRVLAIWNRTYGDGHPRVADVIINLGAIEQDRGNLAAAESLYRRGSDVMERWYGPDHLRTAGTVSMLGRVALLQRRSDEADSLIRRALAIRRRILGPDHPRVGLMLSELANIAFGRQRLAAAESLFTAAIEVYGRAYPGPHQYAGTAESGLASVYLAKGQPAEAERQARRAVATFEATLPADHLNVGIARLKIGRALLRQRRYTEARVESERALAIALAQAGPASSWVTAIRGDLGEIYRGQGDQAALDRLAGTAPPP
ncbi:MAG: tetratricopeptide repeat protein [Gemmatimonadales bacterium]